MAANKSDCDQLQLDELCFSDKLYVQLQPNRAHVLLIVEVIGSLKHRYNEYMTKAKYHLTWPARSKWLL